MSYQYTVVLRWKEGEKKALQCLSASAKANVFPLFVFGQDRYVEKKATKKNAAISAPDYVAKQIAEHWGNTPFFADLSLLGDKSGIHPLEAVAQSARNINLQLIPAVRANSPNNYIQAVKKVVQEDKNGVALRVDLQQLTSISSWIGNWTHNYTQTDLIVDFEDNVNAVLSLGGSLDHTFATLHEQNKWRSITIIGNSVPENFSGYTQGLHHIDRKEYIIWQNLSSINLPYILHFGDYATIPTVPPPQGIRWGFPINVKYTLNGQFLVCRGVNTNGISGVDMDIQLRDHAQSIAGYSKRQAIPNCWADCKIDAIANGTDGPGNLQSWVQISVNRHIELIKTHLS